MCKYDVEAKIKHAFDLNLEAFEEDRSLSGSGSSTSEFTCTGMLRALEWDVNSGERNNCLFRLSCSQTKNRSYFPEKKYVWMITYQTSLPSCKFCSMITPVQDRALPYSHYLRHISSVEVYEHIYGEGKKAEVHEDHDKRYNLSKRKQEDDHRQFNTKKARLADDY